MTKVLSTGYYPMVVSEIDGPKASKSGMSINWFFTFRIISGAFEGKDLKCAFTDGSEAASILGTLIWMPTAMMLQLIAAILNCKVEEVPDTYDTDTMLNKPFDGKIEVNTGDTGLFNTISTFIPTGKGAAATAIPF